MNNNHPTTRPLEELAIHPDAKAMPRWAKDDPRFLALVDDIRDNGIIQPLIIDPDGRIMDGVLRYMAAKRLRSGTAFLDLPVIVRPAAEAATVMLSGLLHRKHYTKSALAYIAYPLLKPAHEEARRRYIENLKKGPKSPVGHSVADGKKIEDFAEQLGVSKSLFKQAAQVHEIFAKDEDYKALMEPRILAEPVGGEHEDTRPVGLGAVIAGYGGQKATKDQGRQDRGQLELFTEGLSKLADRYQYWSAFDAEAKAAARAKIKSVVAEMPDDLREVWMLEIRAANAAAKGGK